MSNIVAANVLMGFGLGFIFVPLTTLSVSTLRNDQMGNATGIQNLMRNVGGSVGIAWLSTMLVRYAQAHQVFLAGHLSSLDPAYQARLGVLRKAFASNFSPVDALQRAQAAIYNTLLQQAGYWAYVDVFYLVIVGLRSVPFGSGLVPKRQIHPLGGLALNHETNPCHRPILSCCPAWASAGLHGRPRLPSACRPGGRAMVVAAGGRRDGQFRIRRFLVEKFQRSRT